ncbi:Hsp90 co-chaperone Cdc37 [Bimuria novae-zelandiae CBS 107.79]|uniref:Hsp90 chaperone protein kinase-targeting subunit n=1 Tax=Bimuria novae-zelandiae CBS 107.79 TaxID=1447943 RepID=A0A6A5V9M7_9PLEO|nr:Hsp90 co-chaperone Cdc37 [Bimuria novae-zelandiae CBS 107.79]
MVINYSKWDALELSDDSDIEVHPNVDKKSFIRAKQAQIHQERDRRRHQIKTLKYERIINDGLTERIDKLLTALKSHKDKDGEGQTDQLVFQSLMEIMGGTDGDDRPPPPPDGVHEHIKDKPSYPQMMASLVDTVKKEMDEKKIEGNRLDAFIGGLGEHKARVEGLQKELLAKLAELEAEEKKHITSDDIRDGFNFSNVKKEQEASSSKGKAVTTKQESVELLNPPRPSTQRTDTGQSSGADADVEKGSALDDDNGDDIEASPLAKEFAKIKCGDWSACLSFISQHPEILKEKETDGLLVEAFNSELEGKPKHAKQCVHQGLLLQYCRQLGGRDGVALFFKRVQTKDHQANKLFNDDVDSTYRRIHVRAAEIKKEREANAGQEGVEQIQLHAVDPGTTINIRVPPKEPESEEEEARQIEIAARQIFETFPPGLQRALESGSLDEVNKVLAKMSVDEAEEVVGKLGEGGMLSLEEGVVDATTDEGRKVMEEIEKTHKMPGQS